MRIHTFATTFATSVCATALLWCTAAAVTAQEIDDCLACHDDATLVKTDQDDQQHSLYVDKQLFLQSVHGDAGYTCVDCHATATAGDHPADGLPDVQCIECHDDIGERHAGSAHGKLLAAGDPEAPQCYDCHTMHAILPADNAASAIHPDNLQVTCGQCHAEQAADGLMGLIQAFIQGRAGEVPQPGLLKALFSAVPTRLKGHGKVDMGCEYTTRRCGSCHFDAINHGSDELQPDVCVNCHTLDRSSFVFGKIHKASVFTSPLLVILWLVLCGAGIVALVMFCQGKFSRTAKPAPAADESDQSA